MTKNEINWDNLNEHQGIINLPDEAWRAITCIHEGRFEVSNYGRCRRVPYDGYHAQSKEYFVVKISDNGNGYKLFAITKDGKLKSVYAHRMVATYFLGNPDNLPQVNHMQTGLGKHDNRVEHLEWSSNRDNILDAHKHGQMDNRTKVNTQIDIKPKEFIADMYRRYKETGKVGETAREFGVSRTTLSSIVNKRSRVKITDPIDLEFNLKETNNE